MEEQELIPHLFRVEFSRITAVLSRKFGIEHLETAEDIAGETFLAALETWTYKGVPANPQAWLYTVAKNKAKNYLERRQVFRDKITPALRLNMRDEDVFEIDLSEPHISDSQLQMMFTVCHPSLAAESQIALALRVLCGFGIEEIATAFLSNKETIHKRLVRAREKLRRQNLELGFPGEAAVERRLQAVLHTLYLLFNEGYYSESADVVLREDLCLEAMRLTQLLLDNEPTRKPQVYALLSLMCFHASRFRARKDGSGEIILYDDQDESQWDPQLISRGAYLLQQAATGELLSSYHLEATIAYWHTQKADSPEKWTNILQLYDYLLGIQYSPVAALNRIYALSKVEGVEAGIVAAEALVLKDNHYYFTLLGELYRVIDADRAAGYFKRALAFAKTQPERRVIRKKMANMGSGG